jgi:3-(3-hydroxy-phenyl)propionate hydroxylase
VVLGWAPAGDAEAKLRASNARLWQSIGARFLRVIPAYDRATSAYEIRDVEGGLAAWFRRYRAAVAVIRPDRFVFGALPADRAERLGPALQRAIGTPAADSVR